VAETAAWESSHCLHIRTVAALLDLSCLQSMPTGKILLLCRLRKKDLTINFETAASQLTFRFGHLPCHIQLYPARFIKFIKWVVGRSQLSINMSTRCVQILSLGHGEAAPAPYPLTVLEEYIWKWHHSYGQESQDGGCPLVA
jgi:hypothetical protein